MSIVVGEECFSIMIHLESWDRAVKGAWGVPPTPPVDQGNDNQQAGARQNGIPNNGDHEVAVEEIGEDVGEVDEVGAKRSVNWALCAPSDQRSTTGTKTRPAYDSRQGLPTSRDSGMFEKGNLGARQCGLGIEDFSFKLEFFTRKSGAKMGVKAGYHSTFLITTVSFKRVGRCIMLPWLMPQEVAYRTNASLVVAGPETMNGVGQPSGLAP